MILRMITGAALLVVGTYWVGGIMIERDRCVQIEKGAAPVRLVMEIARKADSNFQWVADPLTWLAWSVRADEMTQELLIKAIYGNRLQCAGVQHASETGTDIVPDGSTQYEYDLGR